MLKQKPWITSSILQSIKLRDKLLKQFLKEKEHEARKEAHLRYKIQRNSVVCMVRKSKMSFFNNYFLQYKHNVRKTWDGIKSIIKISKSRKCVPSVISDRYGSAAKTPSNVASAFNNYFSSVGKSLESKIPNLQHTFRKFMPPMSGKSFFIQPTNSKEVANLINVLNPTSAC